MFLLNLNTYFFIYLSLQVDRVEMLDDQAEAYKKAVDEYRTLAEAARAAKASKKASSLIDALPRRQVTHIFTQLRKVSTVAAAFNWIWCTLDQHVLSCLSTNFLWAAVKESDIKLKQISLVENDVVYLSLIAT